MQSLQTNVTIVVPDTHVILEKFEYDRLLERDELGETGDSQWLENVVGINFKLFAKKVLKPNQKTLEKIVKFPDDNRRQWRFKKTGMRKWLDENWDEWNDLLSGKEV